ncbi:MAG: hypothetical protein K8I60_12250, partial [Anaerolineae bacterium]|nr:hypothetical protein [Anaerolineae bacterium]
SATALVAFVVAIYMTGNLYRRAFADVFAPYRYRYANTDISRRLIQQWGSDASVAAFNTAAYRFFAMDVIFDSKLVGWLPAYPVEWSFRVRFFPKNTHYQDMESVTAPPISQTITILHDRRDLHLANFLKEPLRAAYPVETESLTDTFHEGGMPTGTYIPIITPYSVRAVNAFCEQYPQVRCIPVVMQKTKLPPLLNKIQYVDSRDDYRTAAQSIQKILDGVQTSRVTGEVEDRRRFFIPRSVLVLFAPSLFMLFGLLMILILGAVFAASPQAIPDADYEPSFYVGLAVVVLPVMVVPLLTIINGVRRRYSLATLATVNILMMLPGVVMLLSTLTSPDMLCGLPILGAILIIPPGLTALLAWTDVDFGEWFGHEPASPRIWAPHKGLSWGILAYMALLMAGGVALFISTLPQ